MQSRKGEGILERIAKENEINLVDLNDSDIKEISGGAIAARMLMGNYIFISPDMPPNKKEFALAHALGHVLLGHLDEQMDDEQRKRAGRNADMFATLLIALKASGVLGLTAKPPCRDFEKME